MRYVISQRQHIHLPRPVPATPPSRRDLHVLDASWRPLSQSSSASRALLSALRRRSLSMPLSTQTAVLVTRQRQRHPSALNAKPSIPQRLISPGHGSRLPCKLTQLRWYTNADSQPSAGHIPQLTSDTIAGSLQHGAKIQAMTTSARLSLRPAFILSYTRRPLPQRCTCLSLLRSSIT